MPKLWKKARGKLGFLGPHWIKLETAWEFAPKIYREIAFIGVDEDGNVAFWSFTNDGKRSQGTIADVSDLHAEAIGFKAQMPAGLARMAYWPDGEGGFFWVVESKTKKGWNRFTKHQYRAASSETA